MTNNINEKNNKQNIRKAQLGNNRPATRKAQFSVDEKHRAPKNNIRESKLAPTKKQDNIKFKPAKKSLIATTRLNSSIITITFLAMLIVGALLMILLPDKEISERENRALSQFPQISLNSIVSGKTAEDFNNWYSDQFPGRETLVIWWKKTENIFNINFGGDDIIIVDGNSDLGQGALDDDDETSQGRDPEDDSNPYYTSPFFGGGGENPND